MRTSHLSLTSVEVFYYNISVVDDDYKIST